MVPDSEASHEELVKRLRIAASRKEQERVVRIKRELAKRGARTSAIAPTASTTQTRKWWEDRD